MGQSHAGQTCWPKTNGDLEWGDTDADIAIIFNCQSVHECVWDAGGYSTLDAGSFTTLLGFHGDMWLNNNTNNRLEDYMEDSQYNGIGENWVDELTNLQGIFWENPDQCGTAVIWGSNAAETDDQYEYGGFKDFHNTGGRTTSSFYFIEGCNPQSGVTL